MRGHTTFAAIALIATLNIPAPARAQGPAPAAPPAPSTPGPAKPSAEQMVPDDRLGTRVAPLLLLGRPDVRADLRLNPRKEAHARDAIEDLYARALATRGKTGPEALAARREIDEAQAQWLDELLNDDQRARIEQIDLQWEGPAALVKRKGLAEELELSPAQQKSLTEAVARRDVLRRNPANAREAEAQLARAVLVALEPAQRERWHAMLGRPFTLEAVAKAQEPTRR